MEERRTNDLKILEKLNDIDKEMNRVAVNAEIISTKVEERNVSNNLWRTDVCKKFDKIFTWLETLPCGKHDGIDKALASSVNRIWAILIIIIGALAGLAWLKK